MFDLTNKSPEEVAAVISKWRSDEEDPGIETGFTLLREIEEWLLLFGAIHSSQVNFINEVREFSDGMKAILADEVTEVPQ